jgi:hypothetical protein
MKVLAATALCLMTASACGSKTRSSVDLGSGGSAGAIDGGAMDGGAGQTGTILSMLSLVEAPAATQTLFWGALEVSAPGFVVPPKDQLTIGLGPDNSLRYIKWQTLPGLQKTYGDGVRDFPLSGTRAVDLNPDYALVFDEVTVLDSPAPTATHFLLRSHYVSTPNQCDFVESIEGTRSGDSWAIVYSEQGTLFAAGIAANATGSVYPRDPSAKVAALGQASRWSAPVELVAPGFVGPPVDHLTLALDGTGRIQWFAFQSFVRQVSFTGSTQDLPSGGTMLADEGTVSFDSVVSPSLAHVVIRYRVLSNDNLNDFTEGLDSTRKGDSVVVRYFIAGTLRGAAIDAHAAGSLTPVSISAIDAGAVSDGASSGRIDAALDAP